MTDRPEHFLRLSSRLTGFGAFDLRATGMLAEYLAALDARLPANVLDELLARGDDADDQAIGAILADPKVGPVARNVILLWYCGTWNALGPSWSAAYGAIADDRNAVISAAAYQAGLQWTVAGAHPAGAAQQGFGAWSLAPGASQQ